MPRRWGNTGQAYVKCMDPDTCLVSKLKIQTKKKKQHIKQQKHHQQNTHTGVYTLTVCLLRITSDNV